MDARFNDRKAVDVVLHHNYRAVCQTFSRTEDARRTR
jgi:hypothetical protein